VGASVAVVLDELGVRSVIAHDFWNSLFSDEIGFDCFDCFRCFGFPFFHSASAPKISLRI